jgi:hypothetical protein
LVDFLIDEKSTPFFNHKEVTAMSLKRTGTYSLAAFALFFGGLLIYRPHLSRGSVTFLELSAQSPYSWQVAKRVLVPGYSPQEPEWVSKAEKDPNQRMRLNAIRAWAQHPTERLDAMLYSLADSDDSVRAQAQVLWQNTVLRR